MRALYIPGAVTADIVLAASVKLSAGGIPLETLIASVAGCIVLAALLSVFTRREGLSEKKYKNTLCMKLMQPIYTLDNIISNFMLGEITAH
jgi:fluoride ion exporter CrcB/FEX